MALANTDMFAPYKVETWDDIPDEFKDPDGAWVNDYGGYMAIGYDSAKVPDVTSVADLLKPEYKGAVALNGDPTQAGAAFSGVMMAAIANGGSADDIAPGVDFFGDLKKAGNFLPVDPDSGHDRVRPDAGRHRLGLPGRRRRGQRRHLEDGRARRRRWSPATTSRRSTPTPRTRRPPGCGRSSSTATRARTSGSRAAPVRCAATRWPRPARSTPTLWGALPEVERHAGHPDRRPDRPRPASTSPTNWSKVIS